MATNQPTLRELVETLPPDQALACVRSEALSYVGRIEGALSLLADTYPAVEDEGKQMVDIAQQAVDDLIVLLNDFLNTTLIPRLREPE